MKAYSLDLREKVLLACQNSAFSSIELAWSKIKNQIRRTGVRSAKALQQQGKRIFSACKKSSGRVGGGHPQAPDHVSQTRRG